MRRRGRFTPTLPLALVAALWMGCDRGTSEPSTVAEVVISPAADSLAIGESRTLEATAVDGAGRAVAGLLFEWSSLDPEVAVAGADGEVMGVAGGVARIVAAAAGRSGHAEITVLFPAPTLHELEPAVATAGDTSLEVRVRGSGFLENSLLRWNGETRPTAYVGPEELTATLSTEDLARSAEIHAAIVNPEPGGGASEPVVFSVLEPTSPMIDSISPHAAYVGTPSITLEIHGRRFHEAATVTWNGEAMPTTWRSAERLEATMSISNETGPGQVEIRVGNPPPGAATSNPAAFRLETPPAEFAPSIAASWSNTCALDAAGHAYCWGGNDQGQLGTGDFDNRLIPTRTGGGRVFRSLDTDGLRTCGVSAGTVICWNWEGETIYSAGGDAMYRGVTLASSHRCALTDGGQAYCWGSNSGGQLGAGSGVDLATMPLAVPHDAVFRTLDTGDDATCGITATGDLYCWGTFHDPGSQYHIEWEPTRLGAGHTWKSVSVGSDHACGITTENRAYCWWSGGFGQLGTGSRENVSEPAPVAGGLPFVTVSAGWLRTCGVTTSGAAYCWGGTDWAPLYIEGHTASLVPVPVPGDLSFASIEAGRRHACAFTPGGAELYCWGLRGEGALGDGTAEFREEPTPVAGGLVASSLAVGFQTSCALTAAGDLHCWGNNEGGQLADGTTSDRLTPTQSVTGLGLRQVAIGESHACGLTAGGSAYCWGDNDNAQLGDGTNTDRLSPVAVGGGHSYVRLVAGQEHTCGLTEEAAAYCWGQNGHGQLGDPAYTGGFGSPVLVQGGHDFVDLAAGWLHTCGITTNGQAYCWGEAEFGRLGIGPQPQQSPTPVRVEADVELREIAASWATTCALTAAGDAYCWGDNRQRQVGSGSVSSLVFTPERVVVGPGSFRAIHPGAQHTCALGTDDEVYCWGENASGQLGRPTMEGGPGVAGSLRFSQLGSGFRHSCALDLEGRPYCWGSAWHGAVGDGLPVAATTPVRAHMN